VLTRLALATLTEQRRARRWSVFFRFAVLAYLVVLLMLYLPWQEIVPTSREPHTALVELSGLITEDGEASADRIVSGLRAAFADERTAGVIVRINSPGGSPVQAGYITDEIERLREAHPETPLYAVITDVCASGGYWVASAADAIYANEASIVGSIGVLMDGFGFVEAMRKVGVERRLVTAGEHKGLLDPFSPLKAEEVDHIEEVLEQMHERFIEVVKSGRGGRLKDEPDIFSGLVWTGVQGRELGLVDEFGSSGYVAREVIGAERVVDFTPKRDYLERVAERLGAGMARALLRHGLTAFDVR